MVDRQGMKYGGWSLSKLAARLLEPFPVESTKLVFTSMILLPFVVIDFPEKVYPDSIMEHLSGQYVDSSKAKVLVGDG